MNLKKKALFHFISGRVTHFSPCLREMDLCRPSDSQVRIFRIQSTGLYGRGWSQHFENRKIRGTPE